MRAGPVTKRRVRLASAMVVGLLVGACGSPPDSRTGGVAAKDVRPSARVDQPQPKTRARVTRILPTSATWPENLVRLHVEFSAPMSDPDAGEYVALLNRLGGAVAGALTPADAPWNEARTRYTLLVQAGDGTKTRSLQAGRTYTIAVDDRWRDAAGEPLEAAYRQVVTIGPADRDPVAVEDWRLAPPRRDRPDALVVTFPEPLDPDLLDRSLGVASPAGAPVPGRSRIDPGEKGWELTDLAGNPVFTRAYNVSTGTSPQGPTHYRVPFEVR
jgi:hypothetical protein